MKYIPSFIVNDVIQNNFIEMQFIGSSVFSSFLVWTITAGLSQRESRGI